MNNIFEIQKDLLAIFNQIEENEGEITPELEEALLIKDEELKSKIQSYAQIITSLTTDLGAIKVEQDRLKHLKDSKEKTINTIKRIMAEAIERFGNTSKSGSKFIDWGTGKASIRKTTTVEADDERVNVAAKRLLNYFKREAFLNLLDVDDHNVDDVINYINTEKDEDVTPNIDKESLKFIKIKVDINSKLDELLSTDYGKSLLKALSKYCDDIKFTGSVSKTDIKEAFAAGEELPDYAKVNNNNSVIIK